TGNTGGSSSITTGGPLVRKAAASAYQALLGLASTNLGVPVASLSVSKGVVSGGGKTVTYGQLIGDKLFNVEYTGTTLSAGQAPAKPVAQYTTVGIARPARYDIPSIVTGSKVYAANVRVPGMLHGRIVRPRGQGAYGAGSTPVPLTIDTSSIAHIPDVQLVHVNNFLGVVAPKEYDAIQAAAQLKVAWQTFPTVSPVGNFWQGMRAQDASGQIAAKYSVNTGNVDSALAGAAKTVSATYKYHYQMHGPIGPNVAVADVNPTLQSAIIYTHVKDGYGTTRPKISTVLGYPLNQVRIVYYEGSSSFGGGAIHVDTGEAAAIMSKTIGKPVRVQYMRWDEHGWDNYGQAMMFDGKGGVDANGNIVALDWTGYSMAAYSVTPSESLTGTVIPAPAATGGASDTNDTGAQYQVNGTARRYNLKTVPTLNNYFKTSTLRAPNAPQGTFAGEQLIDQLAYAANMDPYLFRLQNITKLQVNDGFNQWRDVLTGVATLANWKPKVANSVKQTGNTRTGRGIAIGGFASSQAGTVADVEVNMKSGKLTVKKLYGAQVAGLSVAPSMIENQISGNLIMGTSRALFEEVVFNKTNVTSLDWVTYPLLRFADHPSVSYQVIQRTDLQPTGSGEPPAASVPAAIANAFFDATGVRLYEAPMTPARVRASLKAAGVS
ncbi:MAG TPA: molybdopterin cofactor-binding domain-containing protein, partial [Gaiellaceae bacterium]|nr:molybdopterin cofactor-binding domain-containing protein [Gaiellaceae bacterium]